MWFRGFHNGGTLTLSSPLAVEIAAALTKDSVKIQKNKRLSRSEGDLRTTDGDLGDIRRSSWSTSGPAEVALDDTVLVMMKESPVQVQLSRCVGAGHLPSPAPQRVSRLVADAKDDSMSDRRSLLSVASGIYEEIPDLPEQLYTKMSRDQVDGPKENATDKCSDKCSVKCETCMDRVLRLEEPTYESVAECVYATMRRTGKKYPPPLPPRLPFGTMKLGESWNSRINSGDAVTRHSSLGSLPRCCSVSSTSSDSKTKTLPKGTRQRRRGDAAQLLGLPAALLQRQLHQLRLQDQDPAQGDPPDAVTRHSSLGSLPRCCSVSSTSSDSKTKTLPKGTRQRRRGDAAQLPGLPAALLQRQLHQLRLQDQDPAQGDPPESWNSRINSGDAVTRHSSLGSLPRCCSVSSTSSDSKTKTLPKGTRQAFSVFRKRLKSDSRIMSPKSETAKENKDVETKKKKFDFTPTRDIFKNFKVSRKMKNLKIAPGSLSKVGETKSCEFLDEEHVTVATARCSKSVECLEPNDEFDNFDLSLEFNDISSLTLPQEIVDLILRSEHMNKIRLKHEMSESDYMPMSPICPPAPIEHHYIAMSPSTNLA
ncbi:uncharacterized protein LOC125234888 [Leguminivora glycinivorella]|uniref:uncharacterized protein LOC125234888 n=1 Tax=Leguminivora glycinivorella TaxID=1035111 RepID=UPI00200E7C51|nr:uncharacterized protein LOC125234888 [Leguminivora glycinivorella]